MRPKSAEAVSCVVLALVVHRAVEDVERLDAELEPDLVGDRRRLGDVQVDLPEAGPAELVVAEHSRCGAGTPARIRKYGCGAAVGDRVRQQVVLAGGGVVVADARLDAVDELPFLLAVERDVLEDRRRARGRRCPACPTAGRTGTRTSAPPTSRRAGSRSAPLLVAIHGNSHTPDAVTRCLRCEKYGPTFFSRLTSSTNALPMPVPVFAPSSVQRGTQV